MKVSELEALLRKHSAVIRFLPQKTKKIVEKRHKNQFPNGKIQYIESFHREMLVVEEEVLPNLAGKILLAENHTTNSTVTFSKELIFTSLEEVYDYLKGKGRSKSK